MTELEAELARIAERESVVQAWASKHPDEDLRAAVHTLPNGPLHGWTLGVKDVIDTVDLGTERGSPIYGGRTTINDAACVALARRAGALLVGKTRTTEFALFTPTVTTNPHDPTRTPGGSSSGSAAAVADGMVRFAFGTQTVGSVIRPAAFCGTVGFKGTHQFVPMTGIGTLAQSLDTLGWFTRSVDDASAVYSALTGEAVIELRPNRPRIGVYRSHQWPSAQAELAGVMDGAANALSDAGADVIELEPIPALDGLFSAANTVLLYEAAMVFEWERRNHWKLISPLLQRMLENSEHVTTGDYGTAQRLVARARVGYEDHMQDHGIDVLLTPSAPGEAPPIKTTGDSVFNREWSALGVPAVALPTGRGPLGLPVGVQLTGRCWADADLLATARWVESATGPRADQAPTP